MQAGRRSHPLSFLRRLPDAPSWARITRRFAFTALALGTLGVGIAVADAVALSTGQNLPTTIVNALVPVVAAVLSCWWASHLLTLWSSGAAMDGRVHATAVALVVIGALITFSAAAQILLEGGVDLVLERSDDGVVYSLSQPLLWLAGPIALAYGIALRHRQSPP